DALRTQHVGRLVREILQLPPRQLAIRAVEALPHHRELVARMLVAHIRSNVVVRRHLPPVSRADLLIRGPHGSTEQAWHRSWRVTTRREPGCACLASIDGRREACGAASFCGPRYSRMQLPRHHSSIRLG